MSLASELEAFRLDDVPELPSVLQAPAQLEFIEEETDAPGGADPDVASTFRSIAGLPVLRFTQGDAAKVGGEAKASAAMHLAVANVSSHPAAAGSLNVILGLREFVAARAAARAGKLWGIRNFARGDEVEINPDPRSYLNLAGSGLLPTLPLFVTPKKMLAQLEDMATRLQLKGIVFLSGFSELPQVSKISHHFSQSNSGCSVVAVLQGVSGWERIPRWLPTAVGFDSACGVLAEIAGDVHFPRHCLNRHLYFFTCCGSPALTLQVALLTQPSMCFIGEDVAQRGLTLQAILDEICDVILARYHDHGLLSGTVLVSDDLFAALGEMRRLREELHKLRQSRPAEMRSEESARQLLEPELSAFFALLPRSVCSALVFQTDVDGLPLLKLQEVEAELGALVSRQLGERASLGTRSISHFETHPSNMRNLSFCPMPTKLDCALGYALGHAAGALACAGHAGYAASIADLDAPPAQWSAFGVPLVRLLEIGPAPERKLVPRRRTFTPEDKVFSLWRKLQPQWRYRESNRQPGPVQFWLRTTNPSQAPEEEDPVEMEELIVLPTSPRRRIFRKVLANLSPLQKLRAAYVPRLPMVLRGPFWVCEVAKSSVCADREMAYKAFPNLWQTDNLKAVHVESITEEVVSVLDKLPDRSSLRATPSSSSMAQKSGGDLHSLDKLSLPVGMRDIDELSAGSATSPQSCRRGVEEVIGSSRMKARIGLVALGRAGPGVNNVATGLFDFLQELQGTLVCIAMGIAGLVAGHSFEPDSETLKPYRNQGGSALLGYSGPSELRDRSTIETFAACAETVRALRLNGLVVWGGCRVHTWTMRLAEYFVEQGVPTCVIGVPASVQSDLPLVEQSLGYDTTCKKMASVIGNLGTQVASSGHQWCFIRIFGNSVSHVAAEVALETHAHVVLNRTDQDDVGLSEVVKMICDVIEGRSREGRNYGVIVVPDQYFLAVREMRQLFNELSEIASTRPEVLSGVRTDEEDFGPTLMSLLSPLSGALVRNLPDRVRAQICAINFEDLDNLAAPDLSQVDTEVIVQSWVETELTRRVVLGTYKGPFQSMTYSTAFHGRSTMPSNFDCDFGYTAGYAAGVFVENERTGLLVDIKQLKEHPDKWQVWGLPLPSLATLEESVKEPRGRRSGAAGSLTTFTIRPRNRLRYDMSEQDMPAPIDRILLNPGPTQFAGPCAEAKTQSLCKPELQRVRQMARTEQLVTELQAKARAGCPPEVLRAVRMLLQGGVQLLKEP